jgi:hypothetical protein
MSGCAREEKILVVVMAIGALFMAEFMEIQKMKIPGL